MWTSKIVSMLSTISTVPFERGSAVDIETDSPLLNNGSAVRIKWPRSTLGLSLESIDTENGLVDIKLYDRNLNSESQPFKELATLASNIPNTGEIDVVIPDLSDVVSEGICQVSIRVEVRSSITGNNLQKKQRITKFVPILIKTAIWAGTFYLAASGLNKILCQNWVNSQSPGIGEEILDLVSTEYPCPPTLSRAKAPNSGFVPDAKDSDNFIKKALVDLQRRFFHPGTAACYRQSRTE